MMTANTRNTMPQENQTDPRPPWLQHKAEVMNRNPNALFVKGYDEAIVGHFSRSVKDPIVAAYSGAKMAEIFCKRNGKDPSDEIAFQDAVEYIEHNIRSKWMGVNTPAIMEDEYEQGYAD